MTKYPLKYRDAVSFGYAAAVLLAMLTVFFPILAYRDYPSVYGQSAEFKLLALGTLGGAVSLAALVGHGARWVAAACGLLAGLGGVGLFLLHPTFLVVPLQLITPNSWPMWLVVLGSAPGFLLFLLTRARSVAPSEA